MAQQCFVDVTVVERRMPPSTDSSPPLLIIAGAWLRSDLDYFANELVCTIVVGWYVICGSKIILEYSGCTIVYDNSFASNKKPKI